MTTDDVFDSVIELLKVDPLLKGVWRAVEWAATQHLRNVAYLTPSESLELRTCHACFPRHVMTIQVTCARRPHVPQSYVEVALGKNGEIGDRARARELIRSSIVQSRDRVRATLARDVAYEFPL